MTRLWLILAGIGPATAVSLLTIFSPTSKAAAAATTYYVCDCQPGADGDCAAGSDSNTGTDPTAPWQSYDKARATFNSSISAGDEIRFCSGGAFDLGSGSGITICNNELYRASLCVVSAPVRGQPAQAIWRHGRHRDGGQTLLQMIRVL